MIKVNFKSHNKEIYCNKGDNLLEVARNSNIFIDAPCNGSVSCGKCKVKLLKGNVDSEKTLHIKDDEWEQGYILACNTTVIEDIEIEVPSKLSSSMHGMKIEGSDKKKDKQIFDRAKNIIETHNLDFKTNIVKTYIEIEEPTLDDNLSDVDRLERHVRNKLGFNEIDFKLELLRKMPIILRENDFKVTITYVKKKNKITILNIESGNSEDKLYGVAIDIGTTSVVVCLVDLYTKEVIDKASSGNAQIKYGADVIHRIIYSTKKDGLTKLNQAVIDDTINPLLESLYVRNDINKDNVVTLVVAGNTTMSSLFLGVYTDYLRQEPFIPPFLKSPKIMGEDIGLNVNDSAYVYLAPSVASYVGGDITAGVLSAGIWASEENILFIDLGTNGEIVFGNKDYMMSCACSAGPAFEGGGISCGMRASNGAIEKVSIDKANLNPNLTIIGECEPIGICGSGIIDLICQMLLTGIIDRRGKIYRDLNNKRIRFNEHDIGEYVLAFKEDYNLENDITVNEVDIDNFIRTKGAIYSGASTLIESLGMDFSVIDKVYIAGGIGNNLNIENSILIGLLPDIEREKFAYIGNSSLVGSYLALISKDAKKKLQQIGNEMTYVELSVYPTYMDEFISACFLPHTNIEQFPTVKRLLED
ncbi:corrinoid activation/regeneration protein AcsV [Romboutsia sedimentorum]|uniref:corrinoid activation/regeneration protein AcsV n=1 Tax=Romboutsia sedimentorum TaxID=1368474 RepID=UPI0024DE4534|nr:corrinoid activation/regeneration protein AcsV [Romboutsia sedimentorum]MDK2586449.1 corrinoid activation/regeneration protein AcsV [Romboutsia sedimentorum]